MQFAWNNYKLSVQGLAKGIREWCKQDLWLGLQKKQGGSLHGHFRQKTYGAAAAAADDDEFILRWGTVLKRCGGRSGGRQTLDYKKRQ